MLVTLSEQIKALATQISEQLTLHADQHVPAPANDGITISYDPITGMNITAGGNITLIGGDWS